MMRSSASEDLALSRAWTDRFLSGPADLPVFLVLDGRPMAGIPAEWRSASRRRRIDANIIETVYEGRDDETCLALRVECAEYLDYPVVEWVAWFTNTGAQPTPVLSDLLALDVEGDEGGRGA